MRHAKRINHLGRTNTHRAAMLSNMACSLIMHKRINTTLAKAKELRKYIEPLITKSKNDTTHSRRVVFSYLQDKKAVTELYREISQKLLTRPGGYLRILKTGFRQGDNAEMCMIEFVDYNETYSTDEKKKTTKTRRSRKSAVKGEQTTETEAPTAKVESTPSQEIEEITPVDEVSTSEVEKTPIAETEPTQKNEEA
jgi:large subunit ribosomal protein L17